MNTVLGAPIYFENLALSVGSSYRDSSALQVAKRTAKQRRIRNMKIILTFILLASIGNLSIAQSNLRGEFVGTWFLQDVDVLSENGEWVPFEQAGLNPFGILMYDDFGNVTVQIARNDRSNPDSEGVIPEIVNGYVAYAGTFEIDSDARTVMHHRLAHINPDLDDLSVVRHYEFEAGALTLTVAPSKNLRLIWKRQDQK